MRGYKVGDRVRVCCRPPTPDLVGTVEAVEQKPWGPQYTVWFGMDAPGPARAVLSFGVIAFAAEAVDPQQTNALGGTLRPTGGTNGGEQ